MKLHSCPFCESSELGTVNVFDQKFQIGCTHCGMMGPLVETQELAERAWNNLCAKMCTHCINRAYGKSILRKIELLKHEAHNATN